MMAERTDIERFNQQLGARLQRLRTDLGIKQETVATSLKVTKSYISKLENGRLVIAAGVLLKYCTIIGVSYAEVLQDLDRIINY